MFGEQFYPTPENLIKKMLNDVELSKVKTILEPSAGKGDILDVIKERISLHHGKEAYNEYDIDCIEKDVNLSSILKGKGHHVVYDDFLKFNTYKKYDLIIMNPPFLKGEKHLLKALEIQKNGGSIVCLLNAATIKNPHTNSRKELLNKLDQKNIDYSIDYITAAFADAERKTNVEVALIKIVIKEKEKESRFRCELIEKQAARYVDDENEKFHVVENDLVKAIVKQYDLEIEMGLKLIKEYKAMKPYILSDFREKTFNKETLKLVSLEDNSYRSLNEATENEYIYSVNKKYWKALFNNPAFNDKFTTNMKWNLSSKIDEIKKYEFSYYNIKNIQIEMNNFFNEDIENTVVEIFDKLSNEYSMEEFSKNIHYYNGWKTNKSWYLNKKVIIPFRGFDTWNGAKLDKFEIIKVFCDIEKSLNFMNGNKPLENDIDIILENAIEKGQTKNLEFNLFKVDFFKKGTAHIEFYDMELVKRLNIYVGKLRSWLPPSYGSKKYNDMDDHERKVIDEFEGEKSYDETLKNKEKYLINKHEVIKIETKKAV